jgi:hypothetical protein
MAATIRYRLVLRRRSAAAAGCSRVSDVAPAA